METKSGLRIREIWFGLLRNEGIGRSWGFCKGLTAFFNVPTCYGDIDCVLVGPGGITAIEAKHHRGTIICEENSWRQVRRVGNKLHGGPMKNPSFQLTQNIRYLKRYLSRFDLDIPIEGIVVFTHPEVVLSVEKQPVRVIRLEEMTINEKEVLGTKEREALQARLVGLAA